MATKLETVEIIPDETAPEILAKAIVDIASAMRKIISTPLKTDTIITLVQADTKLPRKTILAVINSIYNLEKTYIKPAKQ